MCYAHVFVCIFVNVYSGEYYWPGFRIMDTTRNHMTSVSELIPSTQDPISHDNKKNTLNGGVVPAIIPEGAHVPEILPPGYYYSVGQLHPEKIREIPKPWIYVIDIAPFQDTVDDSNMSEEVESCPDIWVPTATASSSSSSRNHALALGKIIEGINQLDRQKRVVLKVINSNYWLRNISMDRLNNHKCTRVDYTPLSSMSEEELMHWSADSVSDWNNNYDHTSRMSNNHEKFVIHKYKYAPLPYIPHIQPIVGNDVKLCDSLLKTTTNLTCFDKC